MKLTLNVIISALYGYSFENTIPSSVKRSYSWAAFPPENPDDMDPEIIYFVDLDDPGNAFETENDCHFFCIKKESITNSIPANCFWVRGIEDITELARLIQGLFLKFIEWESRVNEAIIRNGNYQEMLDATEEILDNPIYILDASYKLVAASANISDDDEIDKTLVRLGYHPSESVEKIKKSGMMKKYSEQTGVIVNPPGNPNKYATVSKWLWDGNMPVVHVVMVCSNSEAKPSLVDIFEMFASYCFACFEINQKSNARTGNIHESLFNDMLFEGLDNQFAISERSKVANIPLTGTFTVFKVLLRENVDYLIRRVYGDILSCLKNARVIHHKYEVVVLNSYSCKPEQLNEKIQEDADAILPLLKQHDAMCGISEPFHEFIQLSMAYVQATKAIGIGSRLQENEKNWNAIAGSDELKQCRRDRYIFRYDEVFVYYFLSVGRSAGAELYTNVPALEKVKELIENDRRHGTDNAQVLYVYLASERKATQAAAILHMHRNNIMYRIPRIEEMLNIDLDDFSTRHSLLLAFSMFELKEAEENCQ